MATKEKYQVIGLMSGTSLDGLDLAHCTFIKRDQKWTFKINAATTIAYSAAWRKKLSQAHLSDGAKLIQTHVEFGHYLGSACKEFTVKNKLKADFIASHGHTVFHQPQNGFTCQIGDGNAIHAVTGIPVVYDFRSLDVIRGGQGAPLVPAGDHHLFSEYDVCLNLGGIANLSTIVHKQRVAYDICFANMGLNLLAQDKGKTFDKNGAMAASGEVDKMLLRKITGVYNRLRKRRPSLGREVFETEIQPLLIKDSISTEDKLATFTETIALEVVRAIKSDRKKTTVLCTGGGAFNSFLLSRFLHHGEDDMTFVVADDDIVKFKEALVFAFLGVLRIRDEANCLRSVTGASQNSSSGILVGF